METKIRPTDRSLSTTDSGPFFRVCVSYSFLSRGACKLAGNLMQEAGAMGDCGADILGNRLPHIRQSVSHPKVYTGPASRGIGENWHVLPRVVRRRPARIGVAAVIRGDDQQIG